MPKRCFTYLCLLVFPSLMARAQTNEPFFLLLNAEREFMWTVQEEGVRKGYLGSLHKESLVFTGEGVREGRSYYRKADPDSAALFRTPERTGATDDGLLGYTLGSFAYRDYVKSGEVDRTGHYLSLWKRKDPTDDWKMVLDITVDHAPGENIPLVDPYKKEVANKVPVTAAYKVVKSKQILMDSDDLLNLTLRNKRYAFAQEEFYDDSVIVMRQDIPPAVGGTSTVKRLEKMQGYYDYKAIDGFLTPTRDIAYTFGTVFYYENIDTVRFSQWYHYVRVWKKNASGLWRIVIDVEKPFDNTDTAGS